MGRDLRDENFSLPDLDRDATFVKGKALSRDLVLPQRKVHHHASVPVRTPIMGLVGRAEMRYG
jgi:hypothetical protein